MKPDQQQQISDVLSLIRELAGTATRSANVADLFVSAFVALDRFVTFDLAAVVMLEQDLDLYIVTREGAGSLVSDALVGRIRQTLETVVPFSLASSDIVVKAERSDLPRSSSGVASLDQQIHTITNVANRLDGLVMLYRGELFRDQEQQILEIFAAQVSLLVGQLNAREQIQGLADTDDLTGIWNKRYFRRQLPQEIERARVYSLPLSLLMFDVDDFKDINDSFGHTVGDVVLSELCGAVRETLRPPDLFARFGGDEFAVILPHTDLGGAVAVAERILQKVRMLTIPTDEEGAIRCSISMGVADCRSEDETANDLIRRADELLYDSKRAGKNRHST